MVDYQTESWSAMRARLCAEHKIDPAITRIIDDDLLERYLRFPLEWASEKLSRSVSRVEDLSASDFTVLTTLVADEFRLAYTAPPDAPEWFRLRKEREAAEIPVGRGSRVEVFSKRVWEVWGISDDDHYLDTQAPEVIAAERLVDLYEKSGEYQHHSAQVGEQVIRVAAERAIKLNSPAHAGFKHSDDYRSVLWDGKSFSLTPNQAAIVAQLHAAYLNGTPDVAGATLLTQADSSASSMKDAFKGNDAWGFLIVPGSTKGTNKLALA